MTVALDSNILIAACVPEHRDMEASLATLEAAGRPIVSLHSLSETFNALTKPAPIGWPPERAAKVVAQFAAELEVTTLSRDDHLSAISRFAASGGIGARLYDFLIGTTAQRAGCRTFVTLNSKHFIALFPDLTILTPSQYLETL